MPPGVASSVAEQRRRGTNPLEFFFTKWAGRRRDLEEADRLTAESERREAAMVGIPDALDFNPQQRTVWDVISPADQVTMAQRSAFPELSRAIAATGSLEPRVQSTQTLEDGTIALIMNDGTVEFPSGESGGRLEARGFALRTIEGAEGTLVFDPLGGTTLRDPKGNLVNLASAEGMRIRKALEAHDIAAATEVGRSTEGQNTLFIQDAWSGVNARPNLVRAIELTHLVDTGGFARASLAVSNFFGVTGADETELSNNLGKAVLSQLRATFGAQFTEREGQLLLSIEANIGKSTEGNRVLLERALRLVDRTIERGIRAAERRGDTATVDELRREREFMLIPDVSGEPLPYMPMLEEQP